MSAQPTSKPDVDRRLFGRVDAGPTLARLHSSWPTEDPSRDLTVELVAQVVLRARQADEQRKAATR